MRKILSVLLLCVFVIGCSGASERVNFAAVRMSSSSERDRKLTIETLTRLPEETQDYKIGPNDVLEIGVFQWELSEETKTLAVRVSQQGTVSLPLIGDLAVAGKTVQEVRVAIEESLRNGDMIKNPRVSVVIKEFRSKRVSVVGAVKDPGTYTLQQNVTRLLDIVALCGGLTETAGQKLYIVRTNEKDAEKQRIVIDLHELMVAGDMKLNAVVSDGDVINVPLAPKFFVYGYVMKPGAYDIKRNTTVLEAIAMSGGLERPYASPGITVIKRGEEEIPVDLVAVAAGTVPDVYLQADDIVQVRQTQMRRAGLFLWDGVRSVFSIGFVRQM